MSKLINGREIREQRNKVVAFNLRMTKSTNEKLEYLANKYEMRKPDVLRQLIENSYDEEIKEENNEN